MATAQVKQNAGAKYEAFVETQIEKARQRIRSLDLMTALLGFVALTLAFAVVMALVDNWLLLPSGARLAALGVYLTGAAVYLGWFVVRPLRRRINPYYAARKVEQTLPSAKNSVVNWLDLHGDPKLSPAIQGALSQRAAKDLASADLDRAVSGRRAGWAGIAVAVAVVAFFVLLVSFGSRKLFGHLGRAFAPFAEGGPVALTDLYVVEPEGGNTTVAVNRPVTIRVRSEGRAPNVVKLLTRPTLADPVQERVMEPVEGASHEWSATVPGLEVRNGFYYRAVGGDATTFEYQVEVRATPTILTRDFTATYRTRPYTGQRVDRVVRGQRDLKDYRGATVRLHIPTNRTLGSGVIELMLGEGKDSKVEPVPAAVVAADPTALSATFVLTRSGKYLVRFMSDQGESYSDPVPFLVTVLDDKAPDVRLEKPGKDETRPADDLVEITGAAFDDIGVKEMTLRMRVVDGEALAAKPYRNDDAIRLAGGGYPRALDYKDFVDLAKVTDTDGKPVALAPGMVVEYWLEAKDACDLPRPNVGESKHYKITIAEPKRDDKKKQEQQQKAERDRQEHEKKQDQKRQEENKQRDEEREKQEKANQEANRKEKDDNREGKQDGKPEEKGGKPEEKGGKPDDKDGKNGDNSAEQKRRDEEAKKNRDKLNDAARKHEQEQKSKGKGDKESKPEATGKDEGGKGGEGKDDKKTKNAEGKGDKSGQPDKNKGQGKDQGEKSSDRAGGDDKSKGQDQKNKADASASKDKGEKGADQKQNQARGKNETEKKDQPQDNRSAGKDSEGQHSGEKQATGKDGGKQNDKGTEAAGKDGGKKEEGNKDKAAGKDGAGQKNDTRAASGKDGGNSTGEPGASATGDRTAEAKKGAGDKTQQASADKQAGKDGEGAKTAQGKEGGPPQAGKDNQGVAKDQQPKTQPRGTGKDEGKERTADAGQGKKGPPDGDPMKKQGASSAKPEAGKPDPDKKDQTAAGKGKPDKPADDRRADGSAGDKGPEEARKPDVDKTAKGLDSDDPQERADAERKLRQIEKQAADGEAREAAREALKNNDRTANAKKPPEKDPMQGDGQCAGKDGDDKKGTKAGAGKEGGPPQPQKGRDKGPGEGGSDTKERDDSALKKEIQKLADDFKKGDPSKKPTQEQIKKALDQLKKDLDSDDPAKREAAQKALERAEQLAKDKDLKDLFKDDDLKEANDARAQGETRTGGKNEQVPVNPQDPRAATSDRRHDDRAGDLVLDKFNDAVKKKILKEAGLTEDQVKDIRDLARREAATTDGRTTNPGGTALPSSIDRSRTADDAKQGATSADGLPPVEYRDAYKEFTKRLTEKK